jgi:hypothetical protein
MSTIYHKRAHDIPIRCLPSLRTGLNLIWIDDMCSFSALRAETLDRLRAINTCTIVLYTNVSKCLKYLKQAKAYERTVLVINIDRNLIDFNDISRLLQYKQVQCILIVISADDTNSSTNIDLQNKIRTEMIKRCEVIHDYQSLLNRFDHLLKEADQFDDDFFVFFNRTEKSMRNLRNDLSTYIWSQSLRG